jgi:3D (Asp-Asp-Asp) domain-containing protein
VTLALLLIAALAQAAEWVPVEATLTSYCPCKICCGARAKGITADGTDTKEYPYGLAADLRALPAGSRIWIPTGIGYLDATFPTDRGFVVDDTGGALIRNTRKTGRIHLDLRFRYHGSAVRFGVKTVTVYVWKE